MARAEEGRRGRVENGRRGKEIYLNADSHKWVDRGPGPANTCAENLMTLLRETG